MRLTQRTASLSSRLLTATHQLGKRLPEVKHRFSMKTTFRHCLLLNYSMEPHILQRVLPRGLTSDVVETPKGPRAFLSVVVADLEAMRPGMLPRGLGFDFTQVVYRAVVQAPTGERGVYFVRSDADSMPMSLAGNVFSNFNFHAADCCWVGREALAEAAADRLAQAESSDAPLRPQLEGKEWLPTADVDGSSVAAASQHMHFLLEPKGQNDEPASLAVSLDTSSASLTMPQSSAFAGQDVRHAQKFFVELYAAFHSWPSHDHWSAVRIDRTNWKVVSLNHASAPQVDFMEKSSAFPPGTCTLDSTFYVHALDYHWHAIDRQPFYVPSAQTATAAAAAAAASAVNSGTVGEAASAAAQASGMVTFFYDGECPVCIREVGHWRKLIDGAGGNAAVGIDLVDLTKEGVSSGGMLKELGVSLDEALGRAHAVDERGRLRTGISAFVPLWARLPGWQYLAMVMRLPLAVEVAEVGYSVWNVLRPKLGELVGQPAPTKVAAAAAPGASCRIDDRASCSAPTK